MISLLDLIHLNEYPIKFITEKRLDYLRKLGINLK